MLAPPADGGGGSPWWRAINDGLLRDKVEADLLAAGSGDEPSSRTVGLWLEFIAAPSAATWYRAHNASVVAGYLKHEPPSDVSRRHQLAASPGDRDRDRTQATRPLICPRYRRPPSSTLRSAHGTASSRSSGIGSPLAIERP